MKSQMAFEQRKDFGIRLESMKENQVPFVFFMEKQYTSTRAIPVQPLWQGKTHFLFSSPFFLSKNLTYAPDK